MGAPSFPDEYCDRLNKNVGLGRRACGRGREGGGEGRGAIRVFRGRKLAVPDNVGGMLTNHDSRPPARAPWLPALRQPLDDWPSNTPLASPL